MEKTRKVTDMTTGDPIRIVMTFAVPLLIGNIFQQVYNLVDTMIAGQYLGDDGIAAIGATSIIFALLVNISWGLNNGFCVILSQFFGAGEKKKFRNAVFTMVFLNLAVAAILTVIALLFLRSFMRGISTPEDIFEDAYRYILIIVIGLTATVLYNMCSGYMRAIGNSKTPLYFLILSSVLNVILDILFVTVLSLGISGLALSTVIAQGLSALLSILYIVKQYKEHLPDHQSCHLEKRMVGEMLSTGGSMAMMQSVVCIGSVVMQKGINLLGTDIITANTASRKVFEMLMVPMASISSANATFVGQNYGAGNLDRIQESNRKMLLVELSWSLVSVAVSWVFGRALIVWLTGSQNEFIISNALLNLRLSTAFFFPLGALFVLRYSMQAMGHKVLPIFSSGIEMLVKFLSAYLLVPRYGYWGVVVAEPSIWFICAVFLAICYVTIGHQRTSLARGATV